MGFCRHVYFEIKETTCQKVFYRLEFYCNRKIPMADQCLGLGLIGVSFD